MEINTDGCTSERCGASASSHSARSICVKCSLAARPAGRECGRLGRQYLDCSKSIGRRTTCDAHVADFNSAPPTSSWLPKGRLLRGGQLPLTDGMPQQISRERSVGSMDYLQALDAICHLFIRKRARAQILSGP